MKYLILLALAQTALSAGYERLFDNPKTRRKINPEPFLRLVPKIRNSSGNPLYIVARILDTLRFEGYDIGNYLSSGAFKDVFTLKSRKGIPCVAKVSHGVMPVKSHINEINKQPKSEISKFVLQCKRSFLVELADKKIKKYGLEPVFVEIQEMGTPAKDVYNKCSTAKEKDAFHKKMCHLRSKIRATGHDVVDFNYDNVAEFEDGRLLIIDLGCVVPYNGPLLSALMKPSSPSNSDMSMS